jgi:hypothetical protein
MIQDHVETFLNPVRLNGKPSVPNLHVAAYSGFMSKYNARAIMSFVTLICDLTQALTAKVLGLLGGDSESGHRAVSQELKRFVACTIGRIKYRREGPAALKSPSQATTLSPFSFARGLFNTSRTNPRRLIGSILRAPSRAVAFAVRCRAHKVPDRITYISHAITLPPQLLALFR